MDSVKQGARVADPRDEEEREKRAQDALEWSQHALEHERKRRPRILSITGPLARYRTENHFSELLKNLFDGS